MCLLPENEVRKDVIPLREWVPECFAKDEPVVLRPSWNGIAQADEGEPLTAAESVRFWVPVLAACGLLWLVVGLIVGGLKA